MEFRIHQERHIVAGLGRFETFGLDVGGVQTEREEENQDKHPFFSDLCVGHFRGTNTSLR